jgi:hypothetical protein
MQIAPSGGFKILVGKAANVEVHKGYLGLPWSGKVSPQ